MKLIEHPRWEEILKHEWDYEKNELGPENYTHAQSKKVWWVCLDEGHQYEATTANRTYGYGCPYCCGQKVLAGYNDLLHCNPKVCEEWNYSKNKNGPENYSKSSGKKVWWICKEGHEWESTIWNRILGKGCPYCSNFLLIIGKNDLLTINPKVCEEWNYSKNKNGPENYFSQSNKKVWWICEEGHEYRSVISSKVNGNGCPYCSGYTRTIGVNDLLTTNPELFKEWNYEKNELGPEYYSKNSNKKVWWICEEGHEYESSIYNITKRKSNCPYCDGYKLLIGFNDLKTLYPKLCKEWNSNKNEKSPEFYLKSSGERVWWICEKGHEYDAKINSRVNIGSGCYYCSGQKFLIGYNDLLTTHPELCKEWDYEKNELGPENYSKGLDDKVWWICPKGHSYFSPIYHRVGGTSCPNCIYKSQTITGEILEDYFPNFKIKPEFRISQSIINESGEKIRSSTFVDYKMLIDNKLKIFIEYNGYQHYELAHFHKSEEDFIVQQQRDRWLRNYCQDNNIILIEIDGRKYRSREEIESYLLKKIFSEVVKHQISF